MKHLEEINMSYMQHLTLAMLNAVKLLISSFILIIHGIFPFLFPKTVSLILSDVKFPKGIQDRILVRFNTKWEQDSQKRQWRVLVNGVESLAHKVAIKTPLETIEEQVAGEQKFHFLCFGKVIWNNSLAQII